MPTTRHFERLQRAVFLGFAEEAGGQVGRMRGHAGHGAGQIRRGDVVVAALCCRRTARSLERRGSYWLSVWQRGSDEPSFVFTALDAAFMSRRSRSWSSTFSVRSGILKLWCRWRRNTATARTLNLSRLSKITPHGLESLRSSASSSLMVFMRPSASGLPGQIVWRSARCGRRERVLPGRS